MLLILDPMSLIVFESVIGKDKLGPMGLEVFKYEDLPWAKTPNLLGVQ